MTPLLRALGALLTALATQAHAVPLVFNADLASGVQRFDAEVAAQGGELHTLTLRYLADGARRFDLPGLTISSLDGQPRLVDDDYAALREQGLAGALSGWAIGLVPNAPVASSGLRFSFDQPVNAFGLEIGDWGTCCFASSLYIAFDGGATLTVATARSAADNPGWVLNGQYTSFIGGIAPGSSFSQVTLYGDGIGEYIVAGGTLRWAQVTAPDLPGSGALDLGPGIAVSVPELNPRALLLAGLIALPWLARRRERPLPVRRLR